MSDAEAAALAGSWGASYESAWKPRFEPVFEALRQVPINVLLWGPGLESDFYPKREQIGAHLADEHTSVATSEALIASDERFAEFPDTLTREGVHAEAADIVIALAVDSRDVTGVHTELTKFGDHPRIGPKIHLFVPRRPAAAFRPLILEAADHVPEARRFDYTPAQYDDCHQIRAKASQWVEELRRERYLFLVRSGAIRPALT